MWNILISGLPVPYFQRPSSPQQPSNPSVSPLPTKYPFNFFHFLTCQSCYSCQWMLNVIYVLMYNINIRMKNHVLVWMLVAGASALFFPLSSRPMCMNIDDQPGKQFKFFYEATGSNPAAVVANFDPEAPHLSPFTLTGSKNQTSFNSTNMKICFVATDNSYKSISFDFYTHDTAHLRELAIKSEIYELHSKLIDVGEKVKELNKNEVFEEERQVIHSDIILTHEWRIQIFAVIKFVIIVGVALVQIYLLKVLLNKTSNTYQSVSQ